MFPSKEIVETIDYSYSDGFDGFRYGQELLWFYDTETAAKRLGI